MFALRVGLLTVSIATAVGLLALLLLTATSPTPVQLQQAQILTEHVQKTNGTVETFLHSRIPFEQKQSWTQEHSALSLALDQANTSLLSSIETAYETPNLVSEIRQVGMHMMNFTDVDLSGMSDRENLLSDARALNLDVGNVKTMLDEFQSQRAEFVRRLEQFEQTSNDLLTSLRQLGNNSAADTVYVASNRIAGLVTTTATAELNDVFLFIGQLEAIEKELPRSQQEPLRRLVNTSYLLNGLKRAMVQSTERMNLATVSKGLEEISNRLKNDQMFAAVAVSDSRILLNVSTILLLSLLAFVGRRLQTSYAELNLSHDDLELRIAERTEELQQANDDLKESQVQLVQAEKMSSLGQLVAGVMHEINTPLLYVQNNTSMTAASVEEIREFIGLAIPLLNASERDVPSLVRQIQSRRDHIDADELIENLDEVSSLATDSLDGLHQIAELVQSLKDFSRLDRVADDKFDVRDGIEKTLVITRNMLKQGVEVIKDLQEVPEIYCSPSRLNQVFINLVTNATQAMDGQGTLTIETRWLRGEAGESVEVSFRDTGCGIPEEHLNKILDPFFTTKPVGQGTGLGLSIVHQIVEQHEGQILIDSKVGVGTYITLNFPVRPSAVKNREEAA